MVAVKRTMRTVICAGSSAHWVGERIFGLLAALGPDKQAVVFAQAPGFAEIHFAALVQAGHHIHASLGQSGQGGVFAIGAVAQEDVALFELVPQSAQQAQVMVMEAAQDDVEDRPAAQGKEHDKLQDGKAAAGLLRDGLGIALLVLRGVGQLGGGAVHDLDGTALESAAWAGAAIGGLGGGGSRAFSSRSLGKRRRAWM